MQKSSVREDKNFCVCVIEIDVTNTGYFPQKKCSVNISIFYKYTNI